MIKDFDGSVNFDRHRDMNSPFQCTVKAAYPWFGVISFSQLDLYLFMNFWQPGQEFPILLNYQPLASCKNLLALKGVTCGFHTKVLKRCLQPNDTKCQKGNSITWDLTGFLQCQSVSLPARSHYVDILTESYKLCLKGMPNGEC